MDAVSATPPIAAPPPTVVPAAVIPSADTPILVGAGDIGECESAGASQTAALLDTIGGMVFTTGDNGQSDGSFEEYQNCYDPAWGKQKARTLPVPGNHDYTTPGAPDYFRYFGARAGPPGLGYYSTRVGAGWLFVGLNSEIDVGPNSAQVQWLRQTLRVEQARCIAAAWHQPFVSSGPSRGTPRMQHLWRILQEFGADIVLQGHDHFYERFAPVNADEQVDHANGIRSFLVGTGGARLMNVVARHPASVARARIWGVLKVFLFSDRYEWEFLSVGGTVMDRGRDNCVGPRPIPSGSSALPW